MITAIYFNKIYIYIYMWYMGDSDYSDGPSKFCSGAKNHDPDNASDGEPYTSNDGHADDEMINSNA